MWPEETMLQAIGELRKGPYERMIILRSAESIQIQSVFGNRSGRPEFYFFYARYNQVGSNKQGLVCT